MYNYNGMLAASLNIDDSFQLFVVVVFFCNNFILLGLRNVDGIEYESGCTRIFFSLYKIQRQPRKQKQKQ